MADEVSKQPATEQEAVQEPAPEQHETEAEPAGPESSEDTEQPSEDAAVENQASPEQEAAEPLPDEQPAQSPEETPEPEEQGAAPEPEKQEAPPKEALVEELEEAAKEVRTLARICEDVLESTATLKYQGAVQDSLKRYSHGLTHLVKTLQILNDARRHIADINKRSLEARKRLVAVRDGADDALSSEEARIIIAGVESRQTLTRIIGSLEALLGNIRNATQPLLELISYEKPGFTEFATDSLRKIRVDIVSDVLHSEEQNIRRFAADIAQLPDLERHAAELESERTPEK